MFFQMLSSHPLSLWIKQPRVEHGTFMLNHGKKSNRFCSEGKSMHVTGFAPCSWPFPTIQSAEMSVHHPQRVFESKTFNILKINWMVLEYLYFQAAQRFGL